MAEIKKVFIEAEKREILKRKLHVPEKLLGGGNELQVAAKHAALIEFLAVADDKGYVPLKEALAECDAILRK